MHIKKINGVLFSAAAVYLQRKTAWTLEYCRSRQLQYMAALQLAQAHFHAATIGLPEVWWAALKSSQVVFFWPFELKAIPLSFNNSFKNR